MMGGIEKGCAGLREIRPPPPAPPPRVGAGRAETSCSLRRERPWPGVSARRWCGVKPGARGWRRRSAPRREGGPTAHRRFGSAARSAPRHAAPGSVARPLRPACRERHRRPRSRGERQTRRSPRSIRGSRVAVALGVRAPCRAARSRVFAPRESLRAAIRGRVWSSRGRRRTDHRARFVVPCPRSRSAPRTVAWFERFSRTHARNLMPSRAFTLARPAGWGGVGRSYDRRHFRVHTPCPHSWGRGRGVGACTRCIGFAQENDA